jgi:hypothetical protein
MMDKQFLSNAEFRRSNHMKIKQLQDRITQLEEGYKKIQHLCYEAFDPNQDETIDEIHAIVYNEINGGG